jgi:imidazolonepropionase-like amidohydrolase
MTDDQLDDVITQSLADQLAAGVTTVRDLGDLRYAAVKRRDRQQIGSLLEPTVVAAGPPITTPGGHCHFMGGVVSDDQSVRAAVVERVARRVDVIKVMTSGGGSTPGTDMLRTQFDTERLRLLAELSHSSGRPVAAHAHGLVAIEQAVEVGVDTIEHCSGMTDGGMELPDATLAAMAERGIAVSGIIPIRADLKIADAPKPVQEYLSRTGLTPSGSARLPGGHDPPAARPRRGGGYWAGLRPQPGSRSRPTRDHAVHVRRRRIVQRRRVGRGDVPGR